MTGELVLDTSAVIAVLRRVSGVRERLVGASGLWLPLPALGELEYGVANSAQPSRQRAALDAFLPAVTLLPLTAETAAHYGRLKAALARSGTPIPENDLWIAALAVEHGWSLATRDAHFARVPGLAVQDWR